MALRRLLADGGRVRGAELQDGRPIEADVVLVGIGVQPNVELAEQAGLAMDNGIAVDEFCRTSDPAILAAGDCCSFPYRGRRIRLESVQNANDQAAVAAHTVAGKAAAYAALPWFWSDQYDTKLQIAGLNQGYDDAIVRPGKTERSLSVWYYQGDSLLAVDAINDAAAYVTAKKLLERGANVAKAAVRDPAGAVQGLAGLSMREPELLQQRLQALAPALQRRARTSPRCSGCPAAPARRPGPSTCSSASGETVPLILRRAPVGSAERAAGNASLADQALLHPAAGAAGVPVPAVAWVLQPEQGLGEGFVMQRIDGETLGRRIVGEPRLAGARERLAWQCGQALARIHRIAPDGLPPLRRAPPAVELAHYEAQYRSHGLRQAGVRTGAALAARPCTGRNAPRCAWCTATSATAT